MVERKQFDCNYERNRKRVCEIYGIEPDKANIHHILGQHEVKHGRFKNLMRGKEVNQISNLYPFENGRGRIEHTSLHQKQDSFDKGVIYERKPKRNKRTKRRRNRR